MATTPGGCRQTLTFPPGLRDAPELAPQPSISLGELEARRLDHSARRLRMLLLHLALPLAAAARALLTEKSWRDFGYARLEDHARERFARSGQWVRDYASLAAACRRLDGLEQALTGEDGGTPVGLVATRLIGSVAAQDSLMSWLCFARVSTTRAVRDAVRRARAAGSSWPEDSSPPDEKRRGESVDGTDTAENAGLDAADHVLDRQRLWIHVPYPVKVAFEEGLDLYRAVEGRRLAPSEFVEALVAEASSGSLSGLLRDDAPDSNVHALEASRTGAAGGRSVPGERPEAPTASRKQPLCAPQDEISMRAAARQTIRELGLAPLAGDPDGLIRSLLTLQDEIERELGALLARMAQTTAWRILGYANLDSYAECCLGWGRSTARDRMMLHRTLPRLPVLAAAYGEGRIGLASTLELVRLLRPSLAEGRVSSSTQQAWVERAIQATVKRLRDEARELLRRYAQRQSDDHDFHPLDDAAWHRSLFREAGTARRRIRRLADLAFKAPSPLIPLSLTLPVATAGDFLLTLEAAKSAGIRMFLGDEPRDDRRSTPAWVGLLVLLREFVDTWDLDHSERRNKRQSIYIRDGWRCMAPGCTSRRHLESHHVTYRSHNGSNSEANLVCLCRFHHQLGEHGVLAKVRGAAPLGLMWELGRRGRGGRFLNERRQKKGPRNTVALSPFGTS